MKMYKLIFSGDIAEGADMALVKAKLMSLLKTDAARIEALFNSEATTIKNNINNYELALKYKSAFDNTGAICTIEEQITIRNQSHIMVQQNTKPTTEQYASVNTHKGFQELPKSWQIFLGIFFILGGITPCLQALGVINEGGAYVPDFVLFIFGFAFILAGILLITNKNSITRKILTSVFITIFPIAMIYPIFFMEPDISYGTLPSIIPESVILIIMRIIFVFVEFGLLYAALSSWKSLINSLRPENHEQTLKIIQNENNRQQELEQKGIEQLNNIISSHKGKIFAVVLLLVLSASASTLANFKNIFKNSSNIHFILITAVITIAILKSNISYIKREWDKFNKK